MKNPITSKQDLQNVVSTLDKTFSGFTTALEDTTLPTQKSLKVLEDNNKILASIFSQLNSGQSSLLTPYVDFQNSFLKLVSKVTFNQKKADINLRDDLIKKTITLISGFKVALQVLQLPTDTTPEDREAIVGQLNKFSTSFDSKATFSDWKFSANKDNEKGFFQSIFSTNKTADKPKQKSPSTSQSSTSINPNFYTAINEINIKLREIYDRIGKKPSSYSDIFLAADFTNIENNIQNIINTNYLDSDSATLKTISKRLKELAKYFQQTNLKPEVAKLESDTFFTHMTDLESLLNKYFKNKQELLQGLTSIGLTISAPGDFKFYSSPINEARILLLDGIKTQLEKIFPQKKGDGKNEEDQNNSKQAKPLENKGDGKNPTQNVSDEVSDLELLFNDLNSVTQRKPNSSANIDTSPYSAQYIYTLLECTIGSQGKQLAQIVDPTLSSLIASPFSITPEKASQGAMVYADALGGHTNPASKDNAQTGLMQKSPDKPDKPIVMVINTESSWVLVLRIPAEYKPQTYVKNEQPIKDQNKERIILIDPTGVHKTLPREFEDVLYNGKTYNFILEDGLTNTIVIPPIFQKDKTSFISNSELAQPNNNNKANKEDSGPQCVRAAIGLVINGGDLQFIQPFKDREPALVTRAILSIVRTSAELNFITTEEQERQLEDQLSVFFHLSVVLRELKSYAETAINHDELQIAKNKFAEKHKVFCDLYKNFPTQPVQVRTPAIRNAYNESIKLKKSIDEITERKKSLTSHDGFSFRSGSLSLYTYQKENNTSQNSNSNDLTHDKDTIEAPYTEEFNNSKFLYSTSQISQALKELQSIRSNLNSRKNKPHETIELKLDTAIALLTERNNFNADWNAFSRNIYFAAVPLFSDLKKLTAQILETSTPHLFSALNHTANALNALNIPGLKISNKIHSKEDAVKQLSIISSFIKNNKEVSAFIQSCVNEALNIRHNAIDLETLCDAWWKTFPNSKEISSYSFLRPTMEWINATDQLANFVTTLNELTATNDFKDAKHQILTAHFNVSFIQQDIYKLNQSAIATNGDFFVAGISEIYDEWNTFNSKCKSKDMLQRIKALYDAKQLTDKYSYWQDFISAHSSQQPLQIDTDKFTQVLIQPNIDIRNTIFEIQNLSSLHQAKIFEAFLTEINAKEQSQKEELQKNLRTELSAVLIEFRLALTELQLARGAVEASFTNNIESTKEKINKVILPTLAKIPYFYNIAISFCANAAIFHELASNENELNEQQISLNEIVSLKQQLETVINVIDKNIDSVQLEQHYNNLLRILSNTQENKPPLITADILNKAHDDFSAALNKTTHVNNESTEASKANYLAALTELNVKIEIFLKYANKFIATYNAKTHSLDNLQLTELTDENINSFYIYNPQVKNNIDELKAFAIIKLTDLGLKFSDPTELPAKLLNLAMHVILAENAKQQVTDTYTAVLSNIPTLLKPKLKKRVTFDRTMNNEEPHLRDTQTSSKSKISPPQPTNNISITRSISASDDVYLTSVRPLQSMAVDPVIAEAARNKSIAENARRELYNHLDDLDANIQKVDELRQLNRIIWNKADKIISTINELKELRVSTLNEDDRNQLLQGKFADLIAKNKIKLSYFYNKLTDAQQIKVIEKLITKISLKISAIDEEIVGIEMLKTLIAAEVPPVISASVIVACIEKSFPQNSKVTDATKGYDQGRKIYTDVINAAFSQSNSISQIQKQTLTSIWDRMLNADNIKHSLNSALLAELFIQSWFQIVELGGINVLKEIFYLAQPATQQQIILRFSLMRTFVNNQDIQGFSQKSYQARLQALEFLQTATDDKHRDSITTALPTIAIEKQLVSEVIAITYEKNQNPEALARQINNIAKTEGREKLRLAMIREILHQGMSYREDGALDYHQNEDFLLIFFQELDEENRHLIANNINQQDQKKLDALLQQLAPNKEKAQQQIKLLIDQAFTKHGDYTEAFLFEKLIANYTTAFFEIPSKNAKPNFAVADNALIGFIKHRLTLEHPVVIANFLRHILNISHATRTDSSPLTGAMLTAKQWEELKARVCALSLHTSTSLLTNAAQKPDNEIKYKSLEISQSKIIKSLCALPMDLARLITLLSTLSTLEVVLPTKKSADKTAPTVKVNYNCKSLLDNITWAIKTADAAVKRLSKIPGAKVTVAESSKNPAAENLMSKNVELNDLKVALSNALEKLSILKLLPSVLENIFKQEESTVIVASKKSEKTEIKKTDIKPGKTEIVETDIKLDKTEIEKPESDNDRHLKVKSIASRLITSGASEVVSNTILQAFDKFAYKWTDVNLAHIYSDVLVCENESAKQNFIKVFKEHSPFGVLTVFTEGFKPSANEVQNAFTQLRDRYRTYTNKQFDEQHTTQVLTTIFSQLRDANQELEVKARAAKQKLEARLEVQTFVRLMSSHPHKASRRSLENRQIIFDAFLTQMEAAENSVLFQEYFTDAASTNPKKPTIRQKVNNQALLEMTKYLVDLNKAAPGNISPDLVASNNTAQENISSLDSSAKKQNAPITPTLTESQKQATEKTSLIFERICDLNNSNCDAVVDLLNRMEKLSAGSAGKFLYQITIQAQNSNPESYPFEKKLLNYIFQNGEKNKICSELQMNLLTTIEKETTAAQLNLALLTLFEQIKNLNEAPSELKKEEMSSTESTENIIINLQSKIAQQNKSSSVSKLYNAYLTAHESFLATASRKSTSIAAYSINKSNGKFDRWTDMISTSEKKAGALSPFEQASYLKMYLQKFNSQFSVFKPAAPTSKQMLAAEDCLLALYNADENADKNVFKSFIQDLCKIKFGLYINSLENLCNHSSGSEDKRAMHQIVQQFNPSIIPMREMPNPDQHEPGVTTDVMAKF